MTLVLHPVNILCSNLVCARPFDSRVQAIPCLEITCTLARFDHQFDLIHLCLTQRTFSTILWSLICRPCRGLTDPTKFGARPRRDIAQAWPPQAAGFASLGESGAMQTRATTQSVSCES